MDETKRYKVIKEYTSYSYGFPMRVPVGAILEWWEHRNCYISSAIDGYVPVFEKWAVEAWHDYFEEIKPWSTTS
jgi:hypothetical protein